MSTPKFTPGPWGMSDSHDGKTYLIWDAVGDCVVMSGVSGGLGDQVAYGINSRANARLIAAAPTMYTTLQSIEREGRDANADGDVVIPSEVWDQVRAALAKAVQP